MALNRQETEDLITDLYYNQKKTFREIQRIVRKSPRDIKVILNKAEPERSSLSTSSQAYQLFSEGKTLAQVAIILNIREPEATQFYLEYWKLNQLYSLYMIYLETNGNFSSLIDLYKRMNVAGLNEAHVIELLKIANNDIQSIKRKCQDLKTEEASLNASNLNAARTFQQLTNDISKEYRTLDQYRTSCQEERLELAKLRIQKINLESIIKQIQNNNVNYLKIKDMVKQAVIHSMLNQRHILRTAFLSVIDSCRNDPTRFNILYHNLPLTTRTTETRQVQFDQCNQYNYELYSDELFHTQHNDDSNSDDDVYLRFLLNEAERFFDNRVKELTKVCINRLSKMCNSASIPSQLTRVHRQLLSI